MLCMKSVFETWLVSHLWRAITIYVGSDFAPNISKRIVIGTEISNFLIIPWILTRLLLWMSAPVSHWGNLFLFAEILCRAVPEI